jgi:hypothetical protein
VAGCIARCNSTPRSAARLLLGQHLQDRGERDLFRHLMHLACGHAGQLLAQHADLPHPRQPFLELLQFGGGRQAGAQRFQVGLDGGEMHGHITHLADDLQPVAFGVGRGLGCHENSPDEPTGPGVTRIVTKCNPKGETSDRVGRLVPKRTLCHSAAARATLLGGRVGGRIAIMPGR